MAEKKQASNNNGSKRVSFSCIDVIIRDRCKDAYRDENDNKINNGSMSKIRENVTKDANRRGVEIPKDIDDRIRKQLEENGESVDPQTGTVYPSPSR